MKIKPNLVNVLVLTVMFMLGYCFSLAMIGWSDTLAIVENENTCEWRGETYYLVDIRPRTTIYVHDLDLDLDSSKKVYKNGR